MEEKKNGLAEDQAEKTTEVDVAENVDAAKKDETQGGATQASSKDTQGQAQTSDAFLGGLVCGALGVILIFVLIALMSNPDDNNYEERLTACEVALGIVTPVPTNDAKVKDKNKSETDEKTSDADDNETSVIDLNNAPVEKAAKDKKSGSDKKTEAKATAKPTTTPRTAMTPAPTLSPNQIDWFCSVLVIETNGSRDPKKWDTPEECDDYTWDWDDANEYGEEWLTVAAHPMVTSTLLKYLAYRYQGDYIDNTEYAVKLAKLILANAACDESCVAMLCESDLPEVRQLVFDKILGK